MPRALKRDGYCRKRRCLHSKRSARKTRPTKWLPRRTKRETQPMKTKTLVVAVASLAVILSTVFMMRVCREVEAAHAVVLKIRAQQAEERAKIYRLRNEITHTETRETAPKADTAKLITKPTEPSTPVTASNGRATPV